IPTSLSPHASWRPGWDVQWRILYNVLKEAFPDNPRYAFARPSSAGLNAHLGLQPTHMVPTYAETWDTDCIIRLQEDGQQDITIYKGW
ncbi:MAG: hypothetical protein QGG40_15255, partial [Myxococcota bacterium]|nr:hypothetical protein [Myxococcota bacterium]